MEGSGEDIDRRCVVHVDVHRECVMLRVDAMYDIIRLHEWFSLVLSLT